jgi:RNA ligase (TIGR02306 family)
MASTVLPTKRKLARVVCLEEVSSLDEKLNVSKVEGYTVVTGPSTKNGDVGVFFEVDAILPENTTWVDALSLRRKVIKAIKIRNVVSQGLFVPKENFKDVVSSEVFDQIGTDLTSILKITKVADEEDPGETAAKLAISKEKLGVDSLSWSKVFPRGPSKTDEPRVQGNKKMLEALIGKPYYITLKIDGTSATYGYFNDHLVICSRNNVLTEPNKDYHPVAVRYNLAEKLKNHPNWVIQSENYGPKINKNLLNTKQVDFYVFNIFDTNTCRRLGYKDFLAACDELEVPHVPVLEEGESFNYTIEELCEMSKGKYEGTSNNREGIVIRSSEALMFEGEPLSFKVINEDYLVGKWK